MAGLLDWMAATDTKGALVGGAAVILHGYVRTTEDVDLHIFTTRGNQELVDSLLDAGFEVRDVESVAQAVDFADLTSLIRLTDPRSRAKVDVMVGRFEFQRVLVDSADVARWGTRKLPYCSLDHLMVMKLIASRPRDLDDVRTLLDMHEDKVDRDWVMAQVCDLALMLEMPEKVETARELLAL